MPVPVIRASWLKAGGQVVASELPCPMSRELVGLEPGPVAVVVELALVRLLGLAELVPLVSDPACRRAVSSIPGSQWDFRSGFFLVSFQWHYVRPSSGPGLLAGCRSADTKERREDSGFACFRALV